MQFEKETEKLKHKIDYKSSRLKSLSLVDAQHPPFVSKKKDFPSDQQKSLIESNRLG